MYKKIAIVLVAVLSLTHLTGFGLKDVVPNTGKCDDSKSCKAREIVKAAAIIILADMLINAKTKQTKTEEQVIQEQKAKSQQLPKFSRVDSYAVNLSPSKVFKADQLATVKSSFYITPGQNAGNIKIEERLEILDPKQEVAKSHTKLVNEQSQKGGEFENSFVFTLPKGLQDGLYTARTTLLIDGKDQKTVNSEFQFAVHTVWGNMQVALMH